LVAPEAAGFDAARLEAAIAFAREHETPWSRDLLSVIGNAYFEPPPWNEFLGPVRPRGAPNGLITRHGQLVARWGDTRQVDMTFSVAKSYLGLLAGIAYDRGLLPDPQERVGLRIKDGGFESAHNAAITWHHLLQQTSEWEGSLWDKPDLVDRNRDLETEGKPGNTKGTSRALSKPGTYWEYNDVRVNRLSLSLLRLFAEPLPRVFAQAVMRPIGASSSWEWHGYRNSTVEIGGMRMESVSGGGHWGGGVFIHAEDQARTRAAPGRAAASSPSAGSTSRPHPARSIRATAIYGGSTPIAGAMRAPRPIASSRAGRGAIPPGSIRPPASSRCCAGSIPQRSTVSSPA
jgi:CubicO group peptidase (beta-lactamase class C family)